MEYAGIGIVVIYFLVISLVAVGMTVIDKENAKKHKWRIRERDLYIVAALGGALAMYITMKKLRHKTLDVVHDHSDNKNANRKTDKNGNAIKRGKGFMTNLPLIMAAHVLLIGLFIYLSL